MTSLRRYFIVPRMFTLHEESQCGHKRFPHLRLELSCRHSEVPRLEIQIMQLIDRHPISWLHLEKPSGM